jgi:putative transposase
MIKTYQYRIYPTKRQTTTLQGMLEECCWLYNHLLADRKTTYEETKKGLSRFDQIKTLVSLKEQRPALTQVHSQVLQNVAVRVDLAFKAFFRRVKQGKTPGYPRFRSRFRYDSFTFPQTGFSITETGALRLSKVGDVRIILHRSIPGNIKTCNIKRSSTGKWYCSFSVEVAPKVLPKCSQQVGIDVGLKVFAALSNGETIKNPKFFLSEEKSLAKAQRKLSKAAKGTPERKRVRKSVARIHERIGFKRHNFIHQQSRRIVNNFGVIFVEGLRVNDMLQKHFLSKRIQDASWGMFFDCLSSKAEEAGRQLIAVNPAYTSQTCSSCQHRQPISLSERVFSCMCCGVVLDRDHNASLNILALGLQGLGISPRSFCLQAEE